MKRTILVLTAVGLFTGMPPVASHAADQPILPVLQQLDLNGDMVLYLNTSTIEKSVLDYIDNMSSVMLSSMKDAGPDSPEFQAVVEGVNKVKTAIEWSGLLSLESYAMSTAPVEGTLSRTISIASYAEDDANKPLWRVIASEPKKLKGIGYAPVDAVYTVNSTANLDEAWNVVNEAVATFLAPEQGAAFSQQIAMAEMMLGANITALTGSLDNEILISIQFSEQKQCMVPAGLQTVSIPEPNLIIGLQTKSPLVGQLILKKLQESGAPVVESQHGAYTLQTLNIPMPTPFPVTPTLVQTEDYLLLGSSSNAIVTALDSQANQNGLITTTLYQKLLADAPEKTSGIEFVSPRFMQTYIAVMKQTMSSMPNNDMDAVMNMMLGNYENMYAGGYSLKTPTGFHSISLADYGGAKPLELVASSYAGMLAAIAIPSFEKARSNSQDKVCENNLRILEAATEQWAMENGVTNGSAVTDADISVYIKGGISALKCLKGGTYTIAPVGTPPSCSVHETKTH